MSFNLRLQSKKVKTLKYLKMLDCSEWVVEYEQGYWGFEKQKSNTLRDYLNYIGKKVMENDFRHFLHLYETVWWKDR